tara:strand:+ start:2742 stop:2999 length:258 start_codon:yes stop_codon:yes gene_type:complete
VSPIKDLAEKSERHPLALAGHFQFVTYKSELKTAELEIDRLGCLGPKSPLDPFHQAGGGTDGVVFTIGVGDKLSLAVLAGHGASH